MVYLRTLTSLEHSIVAVYDELPALDGLDEETASLLARLTEDHLATAASLADPDDRRRRRALRVRQRVADGADVAAGCRSHRRWT